MLSSKIVIVAFAALLLCSDATESYSSNHACNKTGNCGAAQKFDQLLQATLLEMGIHKSNQTILSDAQRTLAVPMADELYLAGSGVVGGASFKKAKKMTKDPSLHVFWWVGQLKSGNILFVRDKKTWKNSIAVRETSVVREGGVCTKCGADADVEVYQEAGAVALPGPTTKGLYKVIVDLEQGTVSYKCQDMCWPYTKFGDGLYIVGDAVCGGEWDKAYKKKNGPALTHEDSEEDIYRGTVHLCPHGSFKVLRKNGSAKKGLGLMPGTWEEEQTSLPAKGGFGYMTQFKGTSIPSPPVESDYEVVIDMVHGTIQEHCVGDNCGPDGGRAYYVPENPVKEKESAFVHLFGWRWLDVAAECETFLGPKGYKGVQIQPPEESKVPRKGNPDSWNYGYRPVSYRLNSKYGTEAEFKEMIERCRYAGVDIYADVVLNHMSGTSGKGAGGTIYKSRKANEGIMFDTGFGSYLPEDFHHTEGDITTNCRIAFDETCDETCSKTCDFNGMPDLDTSSPKVQGILAAFMNRLLDLGVAGFRIDAADHIGSVDLKEIFKNVEPKFRWMEARDDADMEEKLYLGRVTQFAYKNKLTQYVVSGDLSKLRTLGFEGSRSTLVPGSEAVVFVVNHDQVMANDENGQGITYKSPTLYTLENVMLLAHPYGYPKVISSFYFPEDHGHSTQAPPTLNVHGDQGELRCGDNVNWVCEHRWPAIANMIRWRKYAGENLMDLWETVESSQVYFCRGKEACIIVNAGEEEWTVTPKLALAPGDYCNIIESDDGAICPKIRVDEEGNAHRLSADGSTSEIKVPGIGAVAMHAGAMSSATA